MHPPVIVDAHVHWWNPAQLNYFWLKDLPALNRAFLPSDYSAASAHSNVSKIIWVECGCDPAQSLAEVDWISALAAQEPRLKAIVAHASLEKGETVRADLEHLAKRPLVRGVRRNLQGESDPEFCLRPNFIAGAARLADFGFSFDLCIRSNQLRCVTELARRVPQVSFILDHAGKPDIRNHQFEPWASDLKELAALPNVACKLSGLATEADWQHWQPDHLEFYFNHAIECFGYDRVLFGSDWPVATLATSYERWVETVQKFTTHARTADLDRLFRSNAERIYHV